MSTRERDVVSGPVADERGSQTRVRRVHAEPVELDDHERPTLVPEIPPNELDAAADTVDSSLEARVLFETRAVEERRRSAAAREDQRATRRVTAVESKTLMGLHAPPPPVVAAPPIELPPASPIEPPPAVSTATINVTAPAAVAKSRTGGRAVLLLSVVMLLAMGALLLREGGGLRGALSRATRAVATFVTR